MSRNLNPVITTGNTADTFGSALIKMNQAINAISTDVVTANGNANGAVTVGNGFVIGIFGANTLVAQTLVGGQVNAAANLVIGSNTTFSYGVNVAGVSVFAGNATFESQVTANAVVITGTANAGSLNVGAINSNAAVVLANTLTVNGATNLAAVTVNGAATLANTLTIGGIANLQANVQITGQLTVNGNIALSGNLLYTGISASNFIPAANNLTLGNSMFSWSVYGTYGYFDNDVVAVGNVTCNSLAANGRITISNTGVIESGTVALTSIAPTIVVTTATASVRAEKLLFTVIDNNSNSFQSTEILVLQDNGFAYSTEYATIYSNAQIGTFSANLNFVSNTVDILFTSVTSNNVTVKYCNMRMKP